VPVTYHRSRCLTLLWCFFVVARRRPDVVEIEAQVRDRRLKRRKRGSAPSARPTGSGPLTSGRWRARASSVVQATAYHPRHGRRTRNFETDFSRAMAATVRHQDIQRGERLLVGRLPCSSARRKSPPVLIWPRVPGHAVASTCPYKSQDLPDRHAALGKIIIVRRRAGG